MATMRNPKTGGEELRAIAEREHLPLRIAELDVDSDESVRAAFPTVGCIINVTSVAGRLSMAPQAAYSSSKFALEAASESLAQEVKAFGVRVAIVEPGVIATAIIGKVQPPPADSNYPNGRRIYELFRTSLENPVSPYVVGEKIREIGESDTWKLRHPVGPDAEGFLA
jgi:hypothetical protein